MKFLALVESQLPTNKNKFLSLSACLLAGQNQQSQCPCWSSSL